MVSGAAAFGVGVDVNLSAIVSTVALAEAEAEALATAEARPLAILSLLAVLQQCLWRTKDSGTERHMSDTEDYPGPTKGHSEKKGKVGQHPDPEDTDEETVKPPATPQARQSEKEEKD